MAASRIGRSKRRVSPHDASQHEGYVEHFSYTSRIWSRWLMTLDNKVLYLSYSDAFGHKEVVDKINIGEGTKIREFPGSCTFELLGVTDGVERRDLFKFVNENDRDMWKAFIVGVSTGVVPEDVKLLPGQLRDIHETVRNVRGPPLPRRTPLPEPSAFQAALTSVYAEPDVVVAEATSTAVPVANDPPAPDNSFRGSEDVNETAASRLMRRTSELNTKILETRSPPVSTFSPRRQRIDPSVWMTPSYLFAPPVSPVGSHGGQVIHLDSEPPHVALEPMIVASPPPRFLNNNDMHPFFEDPEWNRMAPSWFVDCTRDKAEVILMMARRYGNVLMRPSTANSINGKYVITMRSDWTGGSHLSHYAIVRGANGFRIDVDNEQYPMYCLAEVMEFFVSTVGPAARPLRPMPSSVSLTHSGQFLSAFQPEVTSPRLGTEAVVVHAPMAYLGSSPGEPDDLELERLRISDDNRAARPDGAKRGSVRGGTCVMVEPAASRDLQHQNSNDQRSTADFDQSTIVSPERGHGQEATESKTHL